MRYHTERERNRQTTATYMPRQSHVSSIFLYDMDDIHSTTIFGMLVCVLQSKKEAYLFLSYHIRTELWLRLILLSLPYPCLIKLPLMSLLKFESFKCIYCYIGETAGRYSVCEIYLKNSNVFM